MDTHESSGVNLSKSSGLRMMTRTCCADGPFDVIEESYMIIGVHSESPRLYSQRPAIEQKIEIKNLRLGQIKKIVSQALPHLFQMPLICLCLD